MRLVGFSISGIPIGAISLGFKDFWSAFMREKLTWTTLGTQVAQYSNSLLPLFEEAVFYGCREFVLSIEYTSDARELQALFTSDLRDSATRG